MLTKGMLKVKNKSEYKEDIIVARPITAINREQQELRREREWQEGGMQYSVYRMLNENIWLKGCTPKNGPMVAATKFNFKFTASDSSRGSQELKRRFGKAEEYDE